MIEIKLTDEKSFLIIKETLTRMGIANRKEQTLSQSCHIFHKQGRYYIAHFKDMMFLDNLNVDITEEDKDRTLGIALLLEEWELCTIVDKPDKIPESNFHIIPFSLKEEWTLIPKFVVGRTN